MIWDEMAVCENVAIYIIIIYYYYLLSNYSPLLEPNVSGWVEHLRYYEERKEKSHRQLTASTFDIRHINTVINRSLLLYLTWNTGIFLLFLQVLFILTIYIITRTINIISDLVCTKSFIFNATTNFTGAKKYPPLWAECAAALIPSWG